MDQTVSTEGLTRHTQVDYVSPESLKPFVRNARTHSRRQVRQIAQSIERFGFVNPVLVSDELEIIAGHGRVDAAKLIGLQDVPILKLSHLSEAERRAYVLADNKLAENAGWDQDILAIELQSLLDLDVDLSITGFEIAEIDLILDGVPGSRDQRGVDSVPTVAPGPAVTRLGDQWQLGHHMLRCGDARSRDDVAALMSGQSAGLIFTDPPYNVPIAGHVTGLGKVRHREFAFASGEMSQAQFEAFLTETLGHAASVARDGAIAFVCMDWRHMSELLAAGREVFSELKNLCVWNKTNAGMGSFYRSKHELIFVYKVGTAPHTNGFGLGETGRYRTNVWDYAGANALGADREGALSMHPTVKPVVMIEDAIKDCTHRGETVLDIFGGSGSTLIAAEQVGRRACLLELDPLYCDTIIRRFMTQCDGEVRHVETGRHFEDVQAARLATNAEDA